MVDPAEDKVSERSDSSSVIVITQFDQGYLDWLSGGRLCLFLSISWGDGKVLLRFKYRDGLVRKS